MEVDSNVNGKGFLSSSPNVNLSHFNPIFEGPIDTKMVVKEGLLDKKKRSTVLLKENQSPNLDVSMAGNSDASFRIVCLLPSGNDSFVKVGQLAKLITERPQDSLLSNIETNPREQLHVITIRDDEGLVDSNLEPRQEGMARDSIEISSNENYLINSVNNTNHVVQSPLQETYLRSINEARSSSCTNNGTIHERRMLQIDELDECWTYSKEKQKQHHDKLNERTNQFKVGDRVWLDKKDPQIITTELNANGATHFTVFKVFLYGTVEVTYSHFDTFKVFDPQACPSSCALTGVKH
ncbi:hypothetical protein GOBAR_AA12385 [Gossypium barbadense]|uniref:Uncharacterized protein n=1 Tax=Gossypium barbadense TaxID=3634 RepID=A0A2P5XY78_GOSBA|nr:hypothetical protein GOBAR_AA12385 [Gossypium barbadense]